MEMGDWVVELHGHNLGPLFQAIEEQTLFRVRAQSELKREREREGDTFVVGIRFLVAEAPRLPGNGPTNWV